MRTAVIGLGTIGKVHIEILQLQGADIVAVCDTDKQKLAAYPQYKGYDDWRAMLRAERPDIVHVCTPHYLHADMVIEALQANIHVLCEKPLCINADQLARVLAAEKASKAQLGVVLQNRYNPANRFVKEYLQDKRVVSAVGLVAWNRDAAYYASGDWRGKWETEGGGVLINQALHTLDLLQWFAGMPQYVTAQIGNLTLQKKIEVEDTASVLCAGDGNFSLFATNGSNRGFEVELTLQTENEAIKVLPRTVLVNGSAVKTFDADMRVYGKGSYGTGHETLIADFYDCVSSGRAFTVNGEEGAKAVRLVLAAYASKGSRIRIKS